MELTTLETVPGKTITRHLGLVQGSTVRAKHVGRDILAGLKNIVGGELKSYTALLAESRNEALDRPVYALAALQARSVPWEVLLRAAPADSPPRPPSSPPGGLPLPRSTLPLRRGRAVSSVAVSALE